VNCNVSIVVNDEKVSEVVGAVLKVAVPAGALAGDQLRLLFQLLSADPVQVASCA
jgi:hypothetical protein